MKTTLKILAQAQQSMEYSTADCGAKNLMRAVLCRAIADAFLRTKESGKYINKQQAIQWFLDPMYGSSDTGFFSLDFICETLEVEADLVRSNIRKLINDNESTIYIETSSAISPRRYLSKISGQRFD